MQSDKKLIQQMKNGNQDALRILYLRHKDFLLTLANALLHDMSLAEDVLHDVFVNFTRNIGDFHLTSSLKSYLATCVANRARSQLRKQKIHAVSTDFQVEPQASPSHCPIESQEIADRLRMHLSALPDEQREVVVLRVKAGLKFKDIARIQQTSIPTVQGRYRYGIDKLRSLLNGELEK
ncbi:MAG: sigma-70 family RNA polymerase sigma factor [Phycisphaerae bacterium]|nr:sigma-70 family RNA polymerase sigma factor [Phycisphaerae bacterium]